MLSHVAICAPNRPNLSDLDELKKKRLFKISLSFVAFDITSDHFTTMTGQ